ncbi:MAG TPA: D-alanyl-D-alanine carboxypeptidase family protein [Eubacteriales bacterium]|nr:D-alanyl-D-alanine carboxypeptidase family protein [Clostridia bacterium]HRV72600.1 D-alanyl-D-alanine carboxypeptidase family protein [Eubacteriales bacterium]
MIKRVLAIAVALSVVLLSLTFTPISAADNLDVSNYDEKYILLVNAQDPTTALYGIEKDADARCYPASTTKILTCIIALENGNLDDLIEISAEAVDFNAKYNSLMGVSEGESYTLRDLLYGLMLVSGNDAAIAIAEHIGGSVTGFVNMMNSKAQSLGMSSSNFVTPNGKHNEQHYTTARDMAVLTAYALSNATFCEIVGAVTYTATESGGSKTLSLTNANRLLVDATADGFTPESCLYQYAIGVKTGDTDQAGKCLIAAASRGGVTLIAVLLGGTSTTIDQTASEKDPYNARRFKDAATIFDFAFGQMLESVTVQELINLGLVTEFDVQVQNYASDDAAQGILTVKANLDYAQTLMLMSPFMSELKTNAPQLAVTKLTTVFAPISEGDVIGSVEYMLNGTVLFSSELVATRSIEEGLVATATEGAETSFIDNLIGSAVMTPTENKTSSFWIWVVIAVVLIILIVFFITVYVIREKKRRKRAKIAAAKRKKQMQQQAEYERRYGR